MAQVDMFLKLDGIKGESMDAAHGEEMDILSWSWGASQAGTGHSGGGSGGGKLAVRNLSIMKKIDAASPTLFQKCCTGTHIKSGKLTVRKAGAHPLEYIKLHLTDVLVVNIEPSGTESNLMPMESVTLNFTQFHYEYTKQKADGTAGTKTEAAYNMKENRVP
jgi:type VI secretion system secreted protein Hcp